MSQGPPPTVGKTPQRDDVANRLQVLATLLQQAGYDEAARLAFMAAANLDLTDPELQRSWGGPMNGQQGRAKAFLALLAALEPAAVVETGTYRGTTTEWIASNFAGPIHTCEIEPRLYYQSRQKLARFAHVQCELIDSRAFLHALLPTLPTDQPVLFYLDAHWKDDLPLAEEVGAIFEAHPAAVIMIDDFAVPYDAGYAWDDYGPGKRLTLEILIAAGAIDAQVFFPALPSEAETGAKRGCCVLTKRRGLAAKIATLDSFRGADWREWRLVELSSQIERLDRENAQLRVQIAHAREAMEGASEAHAQEREALLQKTAAADAAVQALQQRATAQEQAVAEVTEQAAAQAAQQQQDLAARTAAYERAIALRDETVADREAKLAALAAQHERALAENTAFFERALAEEVAQFEQNAHQLRADLAAALSRARSAETEASDLRSALEVAHAALAGAGDELAALRTRADEEAVRRRRLEQQLSIMKAYNGIIE